MHYCDDAYAAMLLTLALTANREEYARPLSTQEFRRLDAAVRQSPARSPGKLLGLDISGLMQLLGISEEEAYRIFTLLNRSVQLTYSLEGFMRAGIEVITQYDERYPRRLTLRLGEAAPPVFYMAGEAQLLNRPMIAISGISGVKTTPVVRASVERIVAAAQEMGYAVVTGGELGVARLAMNRTIDGEGALVDVLGGGLAEHVDQESFAILWAQGRAVAVSLEHPEALFTVSHAIARNKVLFALAEAAFVFNSDGKRGEIDAIREHVCDFVYAWDGHPGNHAIIAKGALPFSSAENLDFIELRRRWAASRAEQLSLFDMLAEAGPADE